MYDDIADRLPASVLDDNLEVKWDQIADMAQMDSGERIVLKLRLSGLERDLALAACYTGEDRKLLQAAWKRFDRHKDLFKQVLMSGKSLPTQRRVNQTTPANDTPVGAPQLEMVLIELPQGGMKISFRKSIAEK